MTNMGKTVWLAAIIFASICQLLQAQTVPEVSKARLDVVVTTATGEKLVNVTTTLILRDGRMIVSEKNPASFPGLIFDTYRLQIKSIGFRDWTGQVLVDQPEVRATVGLPIGSVGGPLSCSLSGEVSALEHVSSHGNVWIKLVPLFLTAGRESSVDAPGKFKLDKVDCGTYFLVTLRDRAVLDIRTLDLTRDVSGLHLVVKME
jgi:hypothetical protein